MAPSDIKHVFEHHALVTLNLAFVDCISDEAFLSLPVVTSGSSLRFWSPLKILNLGKSSITDLSISKMAFLSQLTEIRLQWCCGITDAGIRILIAHCPRLRVIDLKSCLITDEAVMSIARGSQYLSMLDLSWCSQVTDASLECLASSMGSFSLASLEHLSVVWCCNLTDHGLLSLRELSSLKVLEVSGCASVSSDCIDQLTRRGIIVMR